MIQEFSDHINLKLPFLKEGNVLIACSGGLDSMVLTRLCHFTKINFALAHCNFMLRGEESNKDEAFVAESAQELGVEFFTTEFKTKKYAESNGLSIQMAARGLRYNWFKELALENKFDFVLTAHHADDNLETFLINLSRGSGIDGLVGIPEINDIYVRPLLPFSRDLILQLAKEKEWKWREDSSNQSTKYLRNHLRHHVIPELKKSTPQFLQNFENSLEYLKQSNEFIKNQTNLLKNELFDHEDSETIKVSIQRIRELGNPKSYIFFLFREYGFRSWNDITQILNAQSGKQLFSETHRLVKDREHLLLTPITNQITDRCYTIPEQENMVMITSGTLKLKEVDAIGEVDLKTIYVDKEKLKYPLRVRKWEEGDYFYPLGMVGKKKLSKYFKDEKLSLLAKERVWLVCSGDDIVWIINYRADNRFKITPQTKHILKIKIT